MNKEKLQNLRLGLFIILGTLFLIVAFYLIGNKRNLFGNTLHVSSQFHNINGLMPGNNVRFAGIDVGTVESVDIISDTAVNVVMVIDEKVKKYIKKNAVASVGTDGLMGNKLVNINSTKDYAESIEEGDVLRTLRPFEMDEMLRTLNSTNENIQYITSDLKKITKRISSPNTLWSLLMDSVLAENVKTTIVNIKLTSNRSAIITGDLSSIVKDMKEGKGLVGSLLMDSTFSGKLNQTIVNIKQITDTMALITGDLSSITKKVKKGEGAVGTLLMDTAFVRNLNKSMENIKDGSQGFNDNMEALKHNFLVRKYFRKKEKAKK